MRGGGTTGRGWDRLERGTAAALLLALAAALTAAVRLGSAAAADGGELLARLRERTERRIAAEREQVRPLLAGGGDAALAAAEAALGRLPENSQLHLALAAAYRERGAVPAALREYRRAVELVRDYADRRSPRAIGADLGPWLRRVRPSLSGRALADLHYLERALAGGCA
jgi:tetratricopeptide (TPR) repeat protein